MVEMQAEAEHRKEPKHVPVQDHKAMKKAFEDQHWELTDEATRRSASWRSAST